MRLWVSSLRGLSEAGPKGMLGHSLKLLTWEIVGQKENLTVKEKLNIQNKNDDGQKSYKVGHSLTACNLKVKRVSKRKAQGHQCKS